MRQGGKLSGSSRQVAPPRSMSLMALTISRSGQACLRPHRALAGRSGARVVHPASVRSLPWRSPARPCRRRVSGSTSRSRRECCDPDE